MSKFIHLILIKISSSTIPIPPLLVTFVKYFILGLGEESFRFDGGLWFPFDTNQCIGFFLAILLQWLSIFAVFSGLIPIVCVYIGSCWSIVTFLNEIAKDISELKKKKILNLTEQRLTERFCNFVQFHADVQELSGRFFCETIIEKQLQLESNCVFAISE